MALYQSIGTINSMSEVQSGISQSGFQWQKMTIILDVPGFRDSFSRQVFQVSGDRVSDVLNFHVGDKVEISWAMTAREWNGRWYNNVDLIRINPQEERQPAPAPAPAAKPQNLFNNGQESLNPEDYPDDIPF